MMNVSNRNRNSDTINSVRLAGLKPIFVDMDLETHM